MTDLTSKTVEELRESTKHAATWEEKATKLYEAFDELARRLKEAQHRSEAHDAEVAVKALEEFGDNFLIERSIKYLRDEGIYVGRVVDEKVAELRAKAKGDKP